MLTLAHFLEVLGTGYRPSGREPAISEVVTDSRDARPGSLFVALPGSRVDGHDFVADAFEHGAIAALVSRLPAGVMEMENSQLINTFLDMVPEIEPGRRYLLQVRDTVTAMQQAAEAWRNRFSLRVIGITGSVGKTSTKDLTHAVLSRRGPTMKTPGNENSVLGLPPALFSLRPHHRWAVLEMGMYTPGEIKRLCEMTRPQVGVVTMIDAVHMERAGSLENIVRAKQELVEALPAGGTAILNKDEPLVMGMADHTRAKVLTYGLNPAADLWADDIESMGLNGIHLTLHTGRQSLRVQVPLLGRHSVHTVLRAAAVGRNEGMAWEEIIQGLNEMQSQLRIVTSPGPQGSLILDDT